MIKLNHILNGVVVSEIDMKEGDFNIGRSRTCDLQLDDGVVSGHHAVLHIRQSPYMAAIFDVFIKDLGSTNGTFVNGNKIKEVRLKHGDYIKIGTHEFKIYDDQAGDNTQTEFYVPED